jgi:aspartate aminotransferase
VAISKKVAGDLSRASWIRRMFEEGQRLRAQFGADQVVDLSLGNPVLEPPEEVLKTISRLAASPPPGLHRYMPNAGHPAVREKIAAYVAEEFSLPVQAADIIMTCGAGAALNISLKALLDPGEGVIVVAPFFPEYEFYVENHGGRLMVVNSAADFSLDLAAIEQALRPGVKALILNSPNNPTGRVYSAGELKKLAELLERKSRAFGYPITVLSDEPYRKIVFDGLKITSIFEIYSATILANSHSKDLGLAGERIGYAAISPAHPDREPLRNALTFTNRTLGFVNAPSLFQYVAAENQRSSVPAAHYQQLRDLLCRGLEEAGLAFEKPQGAFYVFPRTPGDEMVFIQKLLEQRVLAVPGAGFACPGHVRMSFCIKREELERAIPAIIRAARG